MQSGDRDWPQRRQKPVLYVSVPISGAAGNWPCSTSSRRLYSRSEYTGPDRSTYNFPSAHDGADSVQVAEQRIGTNLRSLRTVRSSPVMTVPSKPTPPRRESDLTLYA